jgi:hypothetical protein
MTPGKKPQAKIKQKDQTQTVLPGTVTQSNAFTGNAPATRTAMLLAS